MKQTLKRITAIEDPILGKPFAERVGSQDDRIVIECPYLLHAQYGEHHARVQQAIEQAGVDCAGVDFRINLRQLANSKQPRLGAIIAIGSGKGGVGKSTVSAAVARSLSLLGARVGLLDADIYGANQDILMALPDNARIKVNEHQEFIPFNADGIALMTFAGVAGGDTPVIWRGPMIANALQQMIDKTDWPQLDYLIVDMPPGTGDIQLTLFQQTEVAAFVLVTTPQRMAIEEAGKTLAMARKLEIPCLGMVENMNRFICSQCNTEHRVFGEGSDHFRQKHGIELLGSLAINDQIHNDQGELMFQPESKVGREYIGIAETISAALAKQHNARQGSVIATG